ncbi:hypothetical protein BU25DRAFT_420316 [Macroventuria anomochaeta]|uniref:Uncharacterized protein n=1 Tax=Macroventuria anomochaeta TaxID=301207 RepID=A0ACB6S8M3_9PLEO|nr:uncharacterized protein BU25DRAFT_420316 [Macroventuria anomochaeta]KAF2629482.1 hypothetical protein BU25DRAFT_420316 [Macroventuria anomochaeta]
MTSQALTMEQQSQAGQKLGTPAALRSGTRSRIETDEAEVLGTASSRDAEKTPHLEDITVTRNNAYILTGHRRASPSHIASIQSTWRWHNETVNIWAHILGRLSSELPELCFVECLLQQSSGWLVWPFVCFVPTGFACSRKRCCYHTYFKVKLTAADTTSPSTTAKPCVAQRARPTTSPSSPPSSVLHSPARTSASTASPHLRALYQPLAIFFALLCAIATLHTVFSNPTGHRVRTAVYCLLGLASFAPIVHGVLLHGMREHDRTMSLGLYVSLGCCHASGAVLYAVRFPERWYPRTFDLCGSSHQLMHVLVVCGAACYGVGVGKNGRRADFNPQHSTCLTRPSTVCSNATIQHHDPSAKSKGLPAVKVLRCCFSDTWSPMSRHAHAHMSGPSQVARRRHTSTATKGYRRGLACQ